MKVVLLTLLVVLLPHAAGAESAASGRDARVIFDFSTASAWQSIDDVVMGGISRSEMVRQGEVAVFRGVLSLENNGGFASVRSMPKDHDLSGYAGLVVRVRSDGRNYKLRLRLTSAFDGVSYEARLEPERGKWVDVVLPFGEFAPVFRGRPVEGAPPLDPSKIKTFGLMIADGQEGPFLLEIASIAGAR